MAETDAPVLKPTVSEETETREENIVKATTKDGQTTIIIYEHFCKGCEICVDVCPKDVLDMIVAADRWEGAMVKIVNIDNCNACMLCEYECPDFAIEVFNIKKEKKKEDKKTQ